jgi:hypothetical protein
MNKNSLEELKIFIEKHHYKGYDPYDALKSPLFKLPFFKSNKLVRFGTQQLVKRLPFSIRSLLFVPKGYNPVTLGLSIQAYTYLINSQPSNKDKYLKKINFLISELETLVPDGFSGACWGYDFDWEARHAKIPAYQPTVVATGIITNALFVAHDYTGNKDAEKLLLSAADFVVKDLKRTYEDDTFCFSYSPFDQQKVLNASMKGARLLAQAYSINKNKEYKDLAKKAVDYVINKQNNDGSWGYSMVKTGGWIDNYHTGYILDCLDEYQKLTNDLEYSSNIKKGYTFYINHFITDKGEPKFYHNKKLPIDCTAASQTILTTIRFGDKDIAKKVANYMHKEMQQSNGGFKFRKFNNYTITTSFMRWSNAWMFTALAYLENE